jgi:hypothetical protein
MPGQRRALEVTGVLREQFRVLSSQPGELCRLPRCVLSSHARALLLRMAVLKNREEAEFVRLLLDLQCRVS